MTENNLSQLVGQDLTYNWTIVSYLINTVLTVQQYYATMNTIAHKKFSFLHCGTWG